MTPTIVIPCFNEAKRLDTDAFASYDGNVAFLYVNDGSRDNTGGILDSLARRRPGDRVIHLDRNQGKAEAVRLGTLNAIDQDADVVGFWDADLATPLDEIPRFLDVLATRPDVQIVIGARVNLLGRNVRRDPVRHYIGRIFATLISGALGISVYDTQCGAKLFRVSDKICTIFEEPFISSWIFDVELLTRWLSLTGSSPPHVESVFELPLLSWHEVEGSKVGPLDFLRVPYELLKIRKAYFTN